MAEKRRDFKNLGIYCDIKRNIIQYHNGGKKRKEEEVGEWVCVWMGGGAWVGGWMGRW